MSFVAAQVYGWQYWVHIYDEAHGAGMNQGYAIAAIFLGLAAQTLFATNATAHATLVPMVGCQTDGQIGPEPAPKVGTKSLDLDKSTASHLAYYYNSYLSVLAPRNWHCLGLEGSNGASLYVTPRQLYARQFLNEKFKGITGPAVQISVDDGGTSGRFAAARVSARLFPQERKFVESVIAEGIEPAMNFPFGPYPGDRLNRRGANVVEFETPPGVRGFGLQSRLVPNQTSITGAAILLDQDHSTLSLFIRLPHSDRALSAAIIHQVELDNPGKQ